MGSIRTWTGEPVNNATPRCVLLAERHHSLSEGIYGLLLTAFDTVVMVADEASLFESASRLQSEFAIVDISLARSGNGVEMVRRLRDRFPTLRLVIVSIHDTRGLSTSILDAGADGFVTKSRIATDLLVAVDQVIAGQSYVSPRRTGSSLSRVDHDDT